jgi:hypothetical protein
MGNQQEKVMGSVTGKIQTVRKDRKGCKIDDVWYSAYKPEEMNGAQRGDTVTLEYKEKGDFKNIVSVTVVETAPKGGGGGGYSKGGGGGAQFRSVPELNRIDALKLAVDVTAGDADTKERVKHVLKLVPVFVNIIENGGGATAPAKSGDDDAAAKAAAAEAARKAAEAEAKRKAEEEAAAAAQQQAASSALDDFLDD